MTKTEFAKALAAKTDMTQKEAEKTVNAALDIVAEELAKKESVVFPGFGTFEVTHSEARQGRNPSTGETITIAAKDVPRFKAGKTLKDKVNA